MSSSTLARPELVPHLLRQVTVPGSPDFVVNAAFRTFNPGHDSAKGIAQFSPLKGARVRLLGKPPSVTTPGSQTPIDLDCFTDQYGELQLKGGSGPPVIQNVASRDGWIIHFEVLGPANPSTSDLTALSYPSGGTSKAFPISTWSTEGWTEPAGNSGSIVLRPGMQNLGKKREFTVGCFIDVVLRFTRGDGNDKALFPENLPLKLLVDSTHSEDLVLRPGGILRANVFSAVRGKPIEIFGLFKADEIPGDASIAKITTVTADVTVTPKSGPEEKVSQVAGESFGLARTKSASMIALYTSQGPTPFPAKITDKGPRLAYAAYKLNKEDTYQNLTLDEKKCVLYNWFLEFIAYRNLFVRAMSFLVKKSKMSSSWQGVLPLTLTVDDQKGSAFNSGPQNITAHLEYILKPRDDVCIHEMAHGFAKQYLSNTSSLIYYPCELNDHHISSYSNEQFSFQEGFAQFMTGLFMDSKEVFLLDKIAWPKLFKFQNDPNNEYRYKIEFGYDDTMIIPFTKMEESIGLAIEGCFTASLMNIWFHIWYKSPVKLPLTMKPYVQDRYHNGELDTAPFQSNFNAWLFDSDNQQRFAEFILNPVIEAAAATEKVNGRISTRRVLDQIEKAAAASTWSSGTWASLKPLVAAFRAVNDFYISTITPQGGNPTDVVRWVPDQLWYRFPEKAPPVTLASAAGSSTTLALQGIRLPSTGLSAKLLSGTTFLANGTMTVATEYDATVVFGPINTGTLPKGQPIFDLLFETNATPNKSMLFKGVVVK